MLPAVWAAFLSHRTEDGCDLAAVTAL